jgi:hypothetical protein
LDTPWPHFGHTFSNRVQITLEQIGVHVQRHGRVGVAEHPLHHLNVCAGLDSEAGRRVAKRVRRDPRELRVNRLAPAHRLL